MLSTVTQLLFLQYQTSLRLFNRCNGIQSKMGSPKVTGFTGWAAAVVPLCELNGAWGVVFSSQVFVSFSELFVPPSPCQAKAEFYLKSSSEERHAIITSQVRSPHGGVYEQHCNSKDVVCMHTAVYSRLELRRNRLHVLLHIHKVLRSRFHYSNIFSNVFQVQKN